MKKYGLMLCLVLSQHLVAFRFTFENATPFDAVFHTIWTAPACLNEAIEVPAGQTNMRDTSCQLAQVSAVLSQPLGQAAGGSGSPIIRTIQVTSRGVRVIPDNAAVKLSGPQAGMKSPLDEAYKITIFELK